MTRNWLRYQTMYAGSKIIEDVELLHDLAVEAQDQAQVIDGSLVGRDEVGAGGIRGGEGLALEPLPAAFKLPGALGEVVGREVSGDVSGRGLG